MSEDSGRYECLVRNTAGATSVFQNVVVEPSSSLLATLYATGINEFILMYPFIIYLSIYYLLSYLSNYSFIYQS